ncbi:MAG: LCP family protein [Oscillospiraceae bacterium]|nr:LCP family protein [Oscillospiraceae bacterium]
MAYHGKRSARSRASSLRKALWAIYWVIFALSLVVVVTYAAFKLFITPPDVGDTQVIVPNPPVTEPVRDPDPSGTDDPSPSPSPSEPVEELVMHRTEGVFTCLLIGTDDGNGNADTIMLGVFDTGKKTASLISIPRDTLVNIGGRNSKINATYAMGGLQLVADTVASTLAIPVDYYLGVDLAAFAAIVDQIGGVWFTVPVDMDYDDPTQNLSIHVKAGYQWLDGKTALNVLRCRNCYSDADIGRSQTQRDFLAALVKQTVTLSNVTKVTSLMKIVSTYMDTDMPVSTMVYFATQAIGMDLGTSLTSGVLPGDWVYPVIELRDQEVLDLVNSLGIYEEELPLGALNIHHRTQ